MFVDFAARKNGIYDYLFPFDSEDDPEAADSDRPRRTSVNKVI
jgi:hypothetical protein